MASLDHHLVSATILPSEAFLPAKAVFGLGCQQVRGSWR
jgi:hypothetical protein